MSYCQGCADLEAKLRHVGLDGYEAGGVAPWPLGDGEDGDGLGLAPTHRGDELKGYRDGKFYLTPLDALDMARWLLRWVAVAKPSELVPVDHRPKDGAQP